MTESIVIHKPIQKADRLFLLFHGVGSDPNSLLALGTQISYAFPHSMVVSVQAFERCDLGQGFQWFSVKGISEQNRPIRIAQAMPIFISTITYWKHLCDVSAANTVLIGFSQGAIMALESTQYPDAQVGCVFAIAGRFASLPKMPINKTLVHLIHGQQDAVIPHQYTIDAAQDLRGLGAEVTADLIPFAGHELNDEMSNLVVQRLLGVCGSIA